MRSFGQIIGDGLYLLVAPYSKVIRPFDLDKLSNADQ